MEPYHKAKKLYDAAAAKWNESQPAPETGEDLSYGDKIKAARKAATEREEIEKAAANKTNEQQQQQPQNERAAAVSAR